MAQDHFLWKHREVIFHYRWIDSTSSHHQLLDLSLDPTPGVQLVASAFRSAAAVLISSVSGGQGSYWNVNRSSAI